MYLKSLSVINYYACVKCNHTKKEIHSTPGSREKARLTKIERYGDENYNNRVKYKETCLEKYGVDNTSKVEVIKNKWLNTNKERYGVENIFQLENIKEKSKQTKKEKYGDENYNNKDKQIETMLEKYGVKYILQSEYYLNIQRSIKNETMLEKYGNINPLKIKEFIDKRNKTMLERYGTIYPLQNKELKEKALKTKEMNHTIILKDKSDFDTYRNNVKTLTKRNKKQLLEKWNGYDYYDGEYIKDNYELDYNDNNYPSIDHKISVLNGYKNDIEPKIISDIENLCITKRIINCHKSSKNYDEFNN